MKKVLFILKQNLLEQKDCEGGYAQLKSSGLFNSARMVVDVLRKYKIADAYLELAIDGNCIDRLIHKHSPKEVILEAVWVTPAKLMELAALHPGVLWTVRIHSELPFLAQEGIAIPWCMDYLLIPGVRLGFNSLRCKEGFGHICPTANKWGLVGAKSVYMPNLYSASQNHQYVPLTESWDTLDIGCFGAVRPFKNIINQAVAAISLAKEQGRGLRFHINGSRAENGGEATLKSLRAMFPGSPWNGDIRLVEHLWMPHDSFKTALCSMDLVCQVSYTETFNIVAADAVSMGVPVVTSKEVPWTYRWWEADPNSVSDIRKKMKRALATPSLNVWAGQQALSYSNCFSYSSRALACWKKLL